MSLFQLTDLESNLLELASFRKALLTARSEMVENKSLLKKVTAAKNRANKKLLGTVKSINNLRNMEKLRYQATGLGRTSYSKRALAILVEGKKFDTAVFNQIKEQHETVEAVYNNSVAFYDYLGPYYQMMFAYLSTELNLDDASLMAVMAEAELLTL